MYVCVYIYIYTHNVLTLVCAGRSDSAHGLVAPPRPRAAAPAVPTVVVHYITLYHICVALSLYMYMYIYIYIFVYACRHYIYIYTHVYI